MPVAHRNLRHRTTDVARQHSTVGLGSNHFHTRIFSVEWSQWLWTRVTLALRSWWKRLQRIGILTLWKQPDCNMALSQPSIHTSDPGICPSRVPENLLKEVLVRQSMEVPTSPTGTLVGLPATGLDSRKSSYDIDPRALFPTPILEECRETTPSVSESPGGQRAPSIDPSAGNLSSMETYAGSKPRPNNFSHEMCSSIPGLVAVTTSIEYERYERGIIYQRTRSTHIIPALTMNSTGPSLPDRWISYIHPEGMRYFVKATPLFSVVTEARLDDEAEHKKIDHYLGAVTEYIQHHEVQLPPDPFLVLELRKSGNCGYYFVNHKKQCLFWLDSFDFSDMLQHVQIQHTSSLVGLQMRSHYWYHNELFPHLYHLSDENLREIEDMVAFAIGDLSTSGPNSNVTFEMETLKIMQTTVTQFQHKEPSLRCKSVGAAWFIFRMFSTFYEDRFTFLHGEKGARLQPSQTIYGTWDNSWFFEALNAAMLFSPGIQIRKLKSMSVDNIVPEKLWQKFRESILDDWRDVVLYATVVLSANVSFQTIQSVDNEGVELNHRSHSQRASDFSIVTSVGTIIFGLLLLRQHREVMTNASFLVNRSASRSGIETLAIMYSVPYALLLWSMVSFFASFCIVWFQANDTLSTVLISVTCACITLLLLWGISAAYEEKPYYKISLLRRFDDLRWRCQHISSMFRWVARSREAGSFGASESKEDFHA